MDDQALGQYLAERDQQRLQRAGEQFSALSKREQRLVREAAVMGYVQGFQDRPHREGIPGDNDIVIRVLQAADSFGDLYPTLFRAGRRKFKKVSP